MFTFYKVWFLCVPFRNIFNRHSVFYPLQCGTLCEVCAATLDSIVQLRWILLKHIETFSPNPRKLANASW